jgi:hypothetical protein
VPAAAAAWERTKLPRDGAGAFLRLRRSAHGRVPPRRGAAQAAPHKNLQPLDASAANCPMVLKGARIQRDSARTENALPNHDAVPARPFTDTQHKEAPIRHAARFTRARCTGGCEREDLLNECRQRGSLDEWLQPRIKQKDKPSPD